MSFEDFKEKVFVKMHEKGYSPNKTDAEIKAAIEAYEDIVKDGFENVHGKTYGVDYAAWNISLCI